MKTIIIAGGTGLLGKLATTHFLDKGWHVKILSRTPQTSEVINLSYLVWDGKNLSDWAKALEGADVVLNLSGRTVDAGILNGISNRLCNRACKVPGF